MHTSLVFLHNASFVGIQDHPKITNIFGDKLKLLLVHSAYLFGLMEAHGAVLVDFSFSDRPSIISKVGEHIIILVVQIVLGNW